MECLTAATSLSSVKSATKVAWLRSASYILTAALPLILFFPATSSATEQEPDIVVAYGQSLPLQSFPLEAYLRAHPEVSLPPSDMYRTSNDRSYQATWTISKGALSLREVTHVSGDITEMLFPGTLRPVSASWYTGLLCIAKGGPVYATIGGETYATTGIGFNGFQQGYRRYSFLFVHEGRIVKHLDVSMSRFRRDRRAQFEHFKSTDEYARRLSELKDLEPEWSDKDASLYLENYWIDEQFQEYVDGLRAQAMTARVSPGN